MDISYYKQEFSNYLESKEWIKEPKRLYEPIDYIIKLGGKRVRPALTLIIADIFSGGFKKALPVALAIELFHNFTLIHDDVMDQAPLRRGKKTVHKKWNINTSILSGDAMLIMVYQHFENYETIIFQSLIKLFNRTAIEVCEGQQLDIDFETRDDVTIDQYINMIRLKTSVLVATALKMGAIVSEASEKNTNLIYSFGINIGLAFQLQDDFLDIYGDTKVFGKQTGGDIIKNKKTYLYLKSLERANEEDKSKLLFLYKQKLSNNSAKIDEVKRIFELYDIPVLIKEQISHYIQQAFDTLLQLDISAKNKLKLKNFVNLITRRSY